MPHLNEERGRLVQARGVVIYLWVSLVNMSVDLTLHRCSTGTILSCITHRSTGAKHLRWHDIDTEELIEEETTEEELIEEETTEEELIEEETTEEELIEEETTEEEIMDTEEELIEEETTEEEIMETEEETAEEEEDTKTAAPIARRRSASVESESTLSCWLMVPASV